MNREIKILDCTLRDGGQCLESINDLGIKTEVFTDSEKLTIARMLRDSETEIIEIGCMSESFSNKQQFAIYENIFQLSKYIPERKNDKQIFTGLYIDPDTDVLKIPNYSPEFPDGIRVILRYSQLQQSLDFCTSLAKKGYKVFVQPMLTMRYTDDELDRLVQSSNDMGAYALYFVDSFGYMNEKDVFRLFEFYDKKLNHSINIGFHAHNNMENASYNVRSFIENTSNRNIIIDSCAIGMGQGAGNMQTEVIAHYLNKYYGKNYDINTILDICEIIEKFRPFDMSSWGYSPIRFVPAMHEAAYKYAVAMRLKYGMKLSEINNCLIKLTKDMKHRYTDDNLRKILVKI